MPWVRGAGAVVCVHPVGVVDRGGADAGVGTFFRVCRVVGWLGLVACGVASGWWGVGGVDGLGVVFGVFVLGLE